MPPIKRLTKLSNADIGMIGHADALLEGASYRGFGQQAVWPLPHKINACFRRRLETELVWKINVGIENDYLFAGFGHERRIGYFAPARMAIAKCTDCRIFCKPLFRDPVDVVFYQNAPIVLRRIINRCHGLLQQHPVLRLVGDQCDR